jgi:hypothetical protein
LKKLKIPVLSPYFIRKELVRLDYFGQQWVYSKNKNSEWYYINLKDVEKYRDNWSVFGKS